MKVKYFPVPGARINEEQAQRYGTRIDQLKKQHGGANLPQTIITDAKKKQSPLHDGFEWDVQKGFEQNLLNRAYQLIGWIGIKIEEIKDSRPIEKPIVIRRFYFTSDGENAGPRPVSTIDEVVGDHEKLTQVLALIRNRIAQDKNRLIDLLRLAKDENKSHLQDAINNLTDAITNLDNFSA